ncbi:SpoIIE family protein phosphatase [Nocardioides sp. C4-1]|uniref:SpoIIE family protein phosphatase n=1 Tax=Nocardioides sp. C4-1 TaxID=3151851 RepID=UPI0032643235
MSGAAATHVLDELRATGAVGRDLVEVDWAATSLGSPETWPTSLRVAVRIMLTSKFSMWLAWGPDLAFLCNDAYRRDTLGTKYPWALGRPASEVWSEIWSDVEPRVEQVMASGEATWDESLMLLVERSGYVEESYHTFSYSPLAGDDGATAGMLCVVAEVTEQVIAERRMHTLRDLGVRTRTAQDDREALTDACDHLAGNPASLPFALTYLFSDDGTAALAATAGIAAGHPAAPVELGPDDEAVWPIDALRDGEHVVVDDLARRFGDLPTGAWDRPPHEALLVPLAAPSGARPYGFLVVGANPYCLVDDAYRDFVDLVAAHLATAVTDARALQEERRRAEQLATLDQAKSDFLANVSHELRTPLTLLLGPAEDALSDETVPLAAEHRQRLDVVVRNGRRMLELVNSLLDFSRLQAGEDDAVFVRTDLGTFTAELAAMFDSAARRAGLTLEVRCEPGVEVHLDREHWSKVVINLLSNALKFTFEGGITVVVDLADGQARLRVGDTGAGIPDDELPRLFDRFHRIRGARSRTHEGSGIGLALVAQLVGVHGGHVEASSQVGVGTTFTVTLPLGSDHLPPDRVATASGDLAGVAGRNRRRVEVETSGWTVAPPVEAPVAEVGTDGPARARVLVVDDNADMRGYLVGLLQADGYQALGATDGLHALEVLRADGADLVVTDVMMPRLDGFGLVKAIRDDPVLTVTPVIMLSARAGEEGTLEGLAAGADDYLAKPFSARELRARVQTHLALDRAERVRATLERGKELLDRAERLARVGSWEIDLAADTITASDNFVEMLGLTHHDLETLGTTAVISGLVHPDDLTRVSTVLGELPPGEQVAYETRIVLPSGEERLFVARGERPLDADPDGHVLRGAFQDVTDQRQLQDQLVAAEAGQEAALRERAIADALQRSLLPSLAEVDVLDVATYYRAAGEAAQVGGDWYDLIDLGAGRTALVIGDVMGRGVRAAATTGQLRAAVRALVRLDLGPAQILEHLDGIVQELEQDQIVTCVLGIVDVDAMTFSYASAGHLPIVVTGTPDPAMLRGTGPPLGAGFYGVESVTVPVAPGQLLAFYTDGLVERRDSDLVADIERLADDLRRVQDRPVHDQLDEVVSTALARGSGEDDDVAVMLVQVCPPRADDVLHRRLEHHDLAPAEARTLVTKHLDALGVPAAVRNDVVLAVSELVTNAVVHARPPVSLRLRVGDRELWVEVVDRTLLRPQRQRPTDDDEHGRGLNIVASLASSWGTKRTDAGKAVWCSFTW